MDLIFPYLVAYATPILILVILTVRVLTKNMYSIKNQLLAIIFGCYIVIFLGEALRHFVSKDFMPFISMYIVGLFLVISLCASFHLIYVLNNLFFKPLRLLGEPYLFYVPALIHLTLTFIGIRITPDEYFAIDYWYFRNSAYDYWITSFVIISIIIVSISLFSLYSNAKKQESKSFFVFLFTMYIIYAIAFAFILFYVDFKYLTPTPLLYFAFLIIVTFYIGLDKYNFTISYIQRYKSMFTLSPVAILLINEHMQIIEQNEVARSFFEYVEADSLPNLLSKLENEQSLILLMRTLKKNGTLSNYIIDLITKNQEKFTLIFEGSKVTINRSDYFYILWRDQTSYFQKNSLVKTLAYTDSLTKLYNRAYFVSMLTTRLQQKIRHKSDSLSALMLIDLNFFKQINDTYGHAIGDDVLKHTAAIIQNEMNDSDFAARLGGDEFIVFFDQPDAHFSKEAIATFFTNKFSEQPYIINGQPFYISISIGISMYPEDGFSFEQLFQVADDRMYEHKLQIKKNKGPHQF